MTRRYRAYQRIKLAIAPYLRGRTVSLEIHNTFIGFFAHLNWCAELLWYCDGRGLRAQMAATSPQYRDPERASNWLSYFFDLAEYTPHVDFRIANFSELCISPRRLANQTIERTSELVRRNLPVKQAIAAKVDQFCGEQFRGKKILGVHFRGTDKTSEAPRVSGEAMRETVASYLRANKDVDGIFVASDERSFHEYMRDSFHEIRVICSPSNVDTHFQIDRGSANYLKGEEALIDCLLLSRCSTVIRTASFLSAWASIFNPQLPIVMVNRPYEHALWFPDRVLIGRSMDEYLPPALIEQRRLA
jgi:hypothetical protein